jgi:hypothetical protein
LEFIEPSVEAHHREDEVPAAVSDSGREGGDVTCLPLLANCVTPY